MKKLILSLVALLSLLPAKADEGMWMICNLSQRTDSILQSLGLELTQEELYNADGPSLNNAIVMFGGFCSGVVVSNEGLVFTNHHCGFGAIQDHSTPKHDYLTDGFVAKSYKDELPNPDLYVAFHLRTVDVTDKVMNGVTPDMNESERTAIIDSISAKLIEEVDDTINSIYSEVNTFYKGSKYYLSVYQRFDDVRLVFAPPQSLGKFGGDTDNWMWPRQTCDFSVFRIYADKNNKPASYSKDNVPYRPIRYAHVSLQGYQEGSYCMTLGYPGSTDRYLSSYGTENEMRATNDLRIQVRGVKQDILKDAMSKSDAIRIMYASKYANSSNYWKYSIGQNAALEKLGVIDEKRTLENDFRQWVEADTAAHREYVGLLDSLRTRYAESFKNDYSRNLWQESFWNGSDVLRFLVRSLMGGKSEGSTNEFKKKVEKEYKDIDMETDKRVFAALLENYAKHIPDTAFLPEFYNDIKNKFGGDYKAYTEDLYSRSIFAKPEELSKKDNMSAAMEGDPMTEVTGDVLHTFYKMYSTQKPHALERKLGEGIRTMNYEREYYPDANFTLRMSYGIVEGYSPTKDLKYVHYTLPKSLTDKYEQNPGNDDYTLLPKVYKWLKKGKFGKRYADSQTGEMQLCFLTNNDITGGNSGSGMYDGKGRLIGLAFDGNWEAMSGDLKFDNNMQRCIGVDIRYVLSVIESYGKAKRLINELTLE